MKKWLVWLIVSVLMITATTAFAAGSIRRRDLDRITVKEVEPEDPEDPKPEVEVKIVDPTPEIKKIIEEVKTIYKLTIRYITFDGRPVAPTYTDVLSVGTPYSVTSPTVEGYTTPTKIVEGVMPRRDVEYVVIYYPDDSTRLVKRMVTLDDYETPLGIGFSIMNAGISLTAYDFGPNSSTE